MASFLNPPKFFNIAAHCRTRGRYYIDSFESLSMDHILPSTWQYVSIIVAAFM